MNGSLILPVLVFFPMLGALIAYICGRYSKKLRNNVQAIITVAEFAFMLLAAGCFYSEGQLNFRIGEVCARGLDFTLDGFRTVYCIIAALMWMMTSIFSVEYFKSYRNRNRYYFFMLVTLGATFGVLLSADLFTTFVFFEIMSFTSYVWVAHDEKRAALRAAQTYMAVAVIGGLVMLMGLLMLNNDVGTLNMSELSFAVSEATLGGLSEGKLFTAGILILFGFGAKAGMFPLHIWLPKAHPVAPAPASALLSGILTKTGIYGILVISCTMFRLNRDWGNLILILGVITMFGGALLALFSVDLKRTLACSSMSQIGFILVGVGMQCLLGAENALAARGTVLHMMNHSLIKLVLFMCAGAVYMNLHKLNLNDIRGFGRRKPVLKGCFLVGALSIGGIPLFSGYISKTLLHESIVEYIEELEHVGESAFMYHAAEWIFLLTGGMTLAYMTKLFVAVFVEKGEGEKSHHGNSPYMTIRSGATIVLPAALLFALGILPGALMDRIADICQPFMYSELPDHSVEYFSLTNLKGAAISVSIGALLYFFFIRGFLMRKCDDGTKEYVDRWPKWLDLEDRIYRPLLSDFLPRLFGGLFKVVSERFLKVVWSFILNLGKKLAGALDCLADGLFDFLKRTLYKASEENKQHDTLDRIRFSYRKTEAKGKILTSTLSFGMVFICLGLLITLIYLFGLLIR